MPLVTADTGPRSILAYNGEIFEGLEYGPTTSNDSDSVLLLDKLHACCSDEDVVACLSGLRGPWSLVFMHGRLGRVFIGRDVLGRRSLLVRAPTPTDPRLIVTSSAPLLSSQAVGTTEYRELPPGVYSFPVAHLGTTCITRHDLVSDQALLAAPRDNVVAVVSVHHHHWTDSTINLIHKADRERTSLPTHTPRARALHLELLDLMDAAIRTRCTVVGEQIPPSVIPPGPLAAFSLPPQGPHDADASVCIFFSGGVDSTLLAALATRHVPPQEPIDLINIDFDSGSSPDRTAALASLEELTRLDPARVFRLIMVPASLSDVQLHQARITALLHPRDTVMDFNIGSVLWLASLMPGHMLIVRGKERMERAHHLYRSRARVCLLGHGADVRPQAES